MRRIKPVFTFVLLGVVIVILGIGLTLGESFASTGLFGQGEHEEEENNESDHNSHEKEKDKHEKGRSKHKEIHFEQQQVEDLGIKVGTPERGTAHSRITRPATVHFHPDLVAHVGPVVPARVQKVLVVPGDRVKKGEPLALLSSVKLGKAKAAFLTEKAKASTKKATYHRKKVLREKGISSKAELELARSQYKEAQASVDRARELLKLYGLSDRTISNLSFDSGKPFSSMQLRSPITGTVQKRSVSSGDVVHPGDQPFHVVNPEKMWVFVDAYEKDLSELEEGLETTFRTKSLPNTSFDGTVDWISLKLDGKTRTLKLRLEIQNKNLQLRAGMFGKATVRTDPETTYPMIPVDAVQTLHGKKMVFVTGKEKNSFKPVPVTLGEESGDGWVEVHGGISVHESVVISGSFDLKAAFTARSRSAAHHH